MGQNEVRRGSRTEFRTSPSGDLVVFMILPTFPKQFRSERALPIDNAAAELNSTNETKQGKEEHFVVSRNVRLQNGKLTFPPTTNNYNRTHFCSQQRVPVIPAVLNRVLL